MRCSPALPTSDLAQHVATRLVTLGDDAPCLFLSTGHRWVELLPDCQCSRNRSFFAFSTGEAPAAQILASVMSGDPRDDLTLSGVS